MLNFVGIFYSLQHPSAFFFNFILGPYFFNKIMVVYSFVTLKL